MMWFAAGLVLLAAVVFMQSRNETFRHLGAPAELADGVYEIKNIYGNDLHTDLVDTVQCKSFMIGKPVRASQKGWKVKRVSSGVYILFKPNEEECLYVNSDSNQLRSYLLSSDAGCQSKSLCGMQQPDEKGQLDKSSLQTYFMILQHPNGKYYVKNMKNDKFVMMSDRAIKLVTNPTEECLFTITRTQ